MSNNKVAVPEEIIMNKIYLVRNQKVMLDRDLAELYGVETRVLKQAVKRNLDRFPDDFMFEMTKEEFLNWRSQFVTSNSDKMGLRYGAAWIFDGTFGGNSLYTGLDPKNYSDYHTLYNTTGFGVSGGLPIGFTINKGYTWYFLKF